MLRELILRKCLTNYDEETLLMFRELLRRVYAKVNRPIDIVEYGVWQGSWLLNLVYYSQEEQIPICTTGFDTFEYFPVKHLQHKDVVGGVTANATDFAKRVSDFPYKSLAEMHKYLPNTQFIKGDILRMSPEQFINGDIVYLDLDMYEVTNKVLLNLDLDKCETILFDDYEHRFWRGATTAIDELLERNTHKNVVPLYEYLQFTRTNRTKDIYILVNK